MFNKFFDCLNVKSEAQGRRTRNENLLPYRDANDVRLKWLKDEFLDYINKWEENAANVHILTRDEQNRLCISKQTLEGLRITVNSFLELVPLMLRNGAKYVLPDKLNQDPLEEHFGRQRMKGGSNENPNLQDYQYTEMKLQVAKSTAIKVMRGNTRGRKDDYQKIDIHDMTPLPKRQKKK